MKRISAYNYNAPAKRMLLLPWSLAAIAVLAPCSAMAWTTGSVSNFAIARHDDTAESQKRRVSIRQMSYVYTPAAVPYVAPANNAIPQPVPAPGVQAAPPAVQQPVIEHENHSKEIIVTTSTQEDKKKFFFTGVEGSTKTSFGGVTGIIAQLPIEGSVLGNGWNTRLMGYGLGYQSKSGRTTKARGVGTSLVFGYAGSGDYGWWGAYMGPNVSYISLSPDDRGNKSRGRQWALDLQLGGERKITDDFKVNGSLSYQVFNQNTFWMQIRPLMRISNNIFIGPEAIFQGANGYRAWQAGAVVTGFDIGYGTQMGIKAGIVHTKGDSSGAYVGLEFGRSF